MKYCQTCEEVYRIGGILEKDEWFQKILNRVRESNRREKEKARKKINKIFLVLGILIGIIVAVVVVVL